MKRILFLSSIILFAACQPNMLDTAPYSAVSSETMWMTDNLTDKGMIGVYNALRLNTGRSNSSTMYELYETDRFGYTAISRFDEPMLSGTITTGSDIYSTMWKNFYEGIQRANDGIKNIPLKSPSAETKKARYIAECKFFRAYWYYRLNQLYKGVPIYLEPFSAEEATKGRNTEAEVWDQIIKDLTDCIAEPNLPDRYQSGDADYGRVSKSAAYALRGKAYMYMKEWKLAIDDFAKVKECGHTLFPSYEGLFRLPNEQCPEMIFSIQNIGVLDYGGSVQLHYGNRSSRGGWNYIMPSTEMVDEYENADGSKFNWNDVIPGWDALTVKERQVFFLRDDLNDAEIDNARAAGAKMELYLPGGNEARLKKAYENRDPRLDATVITFYSKLNGSLGTVAAEVTLRWPFRDIQIGDIESDTKTSGYYLYRKFVIEGVTDIMSRDYSPMDMPVLRYGDIVLLWAEALNELDRTPEAIEKVNEIRQRAGVALLNSNAATAVTGQDDLRKRIYHERTVELAGEGVIYFDQLRWGTWADNVFKPGSGNKHAWGDIIIPYSKRGDYLSTWPIPVAEIHMNPNLVQNPGWVD